MDGRQGAYSEDLGARVRVAVEGGMAVRVGRRFSRSAFPTFARPWSGADRAMAENGR